MKKKIITAVIFSCIVMGILDAVIKPNYIIKSIIKIPQFFALHFVCSRDLKKELVPSNRRLSYG